MNTSPGVTAVRLPRQVLRAKERADELSKRAVDTPAPAETLEPPPGTAAVSTPAPAPAATSTDFANAEPVTEEGKYWRQRFKVTEGLFRTAREKHATDLEGRDAQVAELRAEIARLKSAQPVETTVQDLSQFLTPDQIEALGEDQARAVATTAMKAARSEVQAMVGAELAPIKARQEAEVQREARKKSDAFTDALDAAVPAWREIDKDPRWHAFLDGIDEATEMQRQRVIDLAKDDANAKPIVRLLKAFQTSLGAMDAPPQSVMPAATGAGSGPAGSPVLIEGGAPTRAEIREHFKLRALGKIKPDEAQKFDARLKAAEAAGVLQR